MRRLGVRPEHFRLAPREPGLTQMRAQRYGTIPVARRVGGLSDTIEDGVTLSRFDYEPRRPTKVRGRRSLTSWWSTKLRLAQGR